MDIFIFLENISSKIGYKIGKNETKDEQELYTYIVFGIISQIFTFGTIFIFSYILNIHIQLFYLILSFILIRINGGGFHCSTFKQCYFTSFFIFIIGSVLSILLYNQCIYFAIIEFIIGIFMIKKCPKKNINSIKRSIKDIHKFKIRYIYSIFLLNFIIFILIYFNFYIYSSAMIFGILIALFTISDTGEYIINKILQIIN